MCIAVISRFSLRCYVVEGAGQVLSSARGLESGSNLSKNNKMHRMSVLFVPDQSKGSGRNIARLSACLLKPGNPTVELIYQLGDVISA